MEVPQEALPFFEIKDAVLLNEQRALMMFPFVKNGVLSRGRVAELLGMNKFDLISIYQRFGMPFIDSPIEDLEEDIANCEMARRVASGEPVMDFSACSKVSSDFFFKKPFFVRNTKVSRTSSAETFGRHFFAISPGVAPGIMGASSRSTGFFQLS